MAKKKPALERRAENLFCCRCKEDFELAQEPATWRMGFLRKLEQAPRRIKDHFHEWLGHETGAYLCGNCYFDLTD